MPKFALVPAFLTGALVMDVYLSRRNRRIMTELQEIINPMVEQMNNETVIAMCQAEYLMAKIIDADIKLNEFELIVLGDLFEMQK